MSLVDVCDDRDHKILLVPLNNRLQVIVFCANDFSIVFCKEFIFSSLITFTKIIRFDNRGILFIVCRDIIVDHLWATEDWKNENLSFNPILNMVTTERYVGCSVLADHSRLCLYTEVGQYISEVITSMDKPISISKKAVIEMTDFGAAKNILKDYSDVTSAVHCISGSNAIVVIKTRMVFNIIECYRS